MPAGRASRTLRFVGLLRRGAASLLALGLLAPAGCARTPTLAPPLLPTSSASPPAPAPDCPSGAAPQLKEDAEPVEAITSFLNAGGDPTALAATLHDLNWITPRSAFVLADLDGDGLRDLAVGLTGPPGGISVWRCQKGAYLPSVVLAPRGQPYGQPILERAIDLTGDRIPELVVFDPLCGAHTCHARYAILRWDQGAFLDVLRGSTEDLPTPRFSAEIDGPGKPSKILITAEGIASVGAGPYRRTTRAWSWDDARSAFLPAADTLEPPRYRIHLIHDADAALEAGEPEQAMSLFQKAIEDDGLMDWPSSDSRAALTAYAAYRMVLAHLALDSPTEAEAVLDTYLAGASDPGAPFASLARLLLTGFAGASLPAACDTVRETAEQDPDSVLAALDYGYANRTYTVDDLCPFRPSG